MKLKILTYKSLRESFKDSRSLDDNIAIVTNNNGDFDLGKNGIKCTFNSADTDSGFFYIRTPLGTSGKLDGSLYNGETWKSKTMFNVDTLASGQTAILATVFSNHFRPEPMDFISANIGKTKLILYVENTGGIYNLYLIAQAEDSDTIYYQSGIWLTGSNPTGNKIELKKWYQLIIERKKDRFTLKIKKQDGTYALEMDNLTFENFNLIDSDNLKWSNHDDTNGDTGDIIAFSDWNNNGHQGILFFADLFCSTPIQYIGEHVVNSKTQVFTNDSIPVSLTKLDDSPNNNDILEEIKTKFSILVKET